MPNLSPLEILMVGVIALVVFGPQKLPQIARTVGRALSELRRMAADVRNEFESGLSVDDEPERPTPSPGPAPSEPERPAPEPAPERAVTEELPPLGAGEED